MKSKDQMNIFGTFESVPEKVEVKTQPKLKYLMGKLYEVEFPEIKLNPDQPRHYFADNKIAALAESIKKQGLIQPLVCIVKDGELQLAAGERRLRAAQVAGISKVPVWIVKGDVSEISLVENMLREDLTAVEEAEAVHALKDKKHYRHEDLSSILGKGVSTISEILAVAALPPEILEDCRADLEMPRDILVHLSRLPTKDKQIDAYQEFKAGNLSRKQIITNTLRSKKKPSPVYSFVTSFSKRFIRFDITKIGEEERLTFRSELEKLHQKISEALERLS
jgi:ParB family chromosome partitioning protein